MHASNLFTNILNVNTIIFYFGEANLLSRDELFLSVTNTITGKYVLPGYFDCLA